MVVPGAALATSDRILSAVSAIRVSAVTGGVQSHCGRCGSSAVVAVASSAEKSAAAGRPRSYRAAPISAAASDTASNARGEYFDISADRLRGYLTLPQLQNQEPLDEVRMVARAGARLGEHAADPRLTQHPAL